MSKRIPINRIVDFAAGRLSREESLALLDRIEQDEQASKDLEMVAATMDLLENEGDALSAGSLRQPDTVSFRLHSFVSSLVPKFRAHPVLSGAAAFALVLVALMIMIPPSSPYGTLASLHDFDFGATVRGVELENFGAAFDLYREGKYGESIKLFERYIRAFPQSKLLGYAHYSAGAAYLRWAEWRVSSFFIGFDEERVQSGMEHLHEVVRASSNDRLLEDARWLLAKGYLMLSHAELATDELQLIVQMGGSRRDEAAEMIRALHLAQ